MLLRFSRVSGREILKFSCIACLTIRSGYSVQLASQCIYCPRGNDGMPSVSARAEAALREQAIQRSELSHVNCGRTARW